MMNRESIRQKADSLRAIPLPDVLRACGAQPDPHDPHKWHTQRGILSVTGAKFINWNQGVGGGGAIDLIIHLHRLGFRDALDWLDRHFSNLSIHPALPRADVQLRLPTPDPAQLGRVRHYLLDQRALPLHLVDSLIQAGTLYADPRANALFLLHANGHTPVGAELRGTTAQPWRGMAPGSKKDLGFLAVPPDSLPAPSIVLCESAIDAISCVALFPQHRCLSTAGARPNPRWLGPLLAHHPHVYCGFDTDSTGDAMASAMIALHPTIQRLAPPHHDWNDTLRSLR
jgi:hypothetical protein